LLLKPRRESLPSLTAQITSNPHTGTEESDFSGFDDVIQPGINHGTNRINFSAFRSGASSRPKNHIHSLSSPLRPITHKSANMQVPARLQQLSSPLRAPFSQKPAAASIKFKHPNEIRKMIPFIPPSRLGYASRELEQGLSFVFFFFFSLIIVQNT